MLSGYPNYGSGFMQPGAGQPYCMGGMYGGGYYGQDGMPVYPNSGYVQSPDYSPTYGAHPQHSQQQYADYSNYGAPVSAAENIVHEVVHEPSKKAYNPTAEPARSALKSPSPTPSPRKADTRTPSPPLKRNDEQAAVPVSIPVPIPVTHTQQQQPQPQQQQQQQHAPQHTQLQPQQKPTADSKPKMVDAATGITVDSGTNTDDFDDLQLSIPILPNKQPMTSSTSAAVKSQRQVPFPEWKPEYSSAGTKSRAPPPMPPAPMAQPQQARHAAPQPPPAIVAVETRSQPAQQSHYAAATPQRYQYSQPAPEDTRMSTERVTSRMDQHKSNPLRNTCPLPSVVDTASGEDEEEDESDEFDNSDVLGQLRQSLKLSTADFNRAVAARMHKKLIEQQEHHKQHGHQQPQRSPKKNAKSATPTVERRSFMV